MGGGGGHLEPMAVESDFFLEEDAVDVGDARGAAGPLLQHVHDEGGVLETLHQRPHLLLQNLQPPMGTHSGVHIGGASGAT